jgi:hypothetical protein
MTAPTTIADAGLEEALGHNLTCWVCGAQPAWLSHGHRNRTSRALCAAFKFGHRPRCESCYRKWRSATSAILSQNGYIGCNDCAHWFYSVDEFAVWHRL